MAPKRSKKTLSKPVCRFRSKSSCGSNGKPIKKSRGRGRPYCGGQRGSQERRKAARGVFRFQGKTYGLTYSTAVSIVSKEQVHAHLQSLLGVHYCCVSRELHADNVQHFHVAGRCDGKLDIDDCHYFDIISDTGVTEHPNICRGGPAWLQYVMKGGDFTSNFPLRTNHMADALAQPTIEAALNHIMTHDASSYVRFALTIENNLRRHFRRLTTQTVPRWLGPYPAGRYPENWCPTTHSLHLYGPPGSGKTCFAQHLLRSVCGECEYIKCHIECLKSLSFTKPFVFDEVMLLCEPAATSREITDVVSGGTIHARYAAITIPPGIPRVFISNQRWVFKNPDESVYGRRLIQFEHPFSCPIEEWRLRNPPRSPSPPPPPPGTPPRTPRSPPPPPPFPWPEVDDLMDITEPEVEPEPDDAFFTRMHEFRPMAQRWEEDSEGFMYRPRPSVAPTVPVIGLAPAFIPMTPPLPAPETPHWSPGWSPLLPFNDVFDMDTDPFLNDDTLVVDRDVDREDL